MWRSNDIQKKKSFIGKAKENLGNNWRASGIKCKIKKGLWTWGCGKHKVLGFSTNVNSIQFDEFISNT